MLQIESITARIAALDPVRRFGRVTALGGGLITIAGLAIMVGASWLRMRRAERRLEDER